MTITPIDTCSVIRLTGEKFQRVRDCKDPLVQALIENYRIWQKSDQLNEFYMTLNPEIESSIIFDTVAVYLTFSNELLKMDKIRLSVTSDGFTKIDETAKSINVAIEWKDLDAYENFLVKRLTQEN